MTCATLDELRAKVFSRVDPAYAAKYLHEVPDLPTVPNRAAYLADKAKGRNVLDLGCTGAISQGIRAASATYHGVDKDPGGDWTTVDLDRAPEQLPRFADVDLVIASELLEHLSNPGRCLDALRAAYPETPVYVTVPHAGAYQVRGSQENVNADHVAWYSYTTLATLLGRSRYRIAEARWYHGQPHTAEGLIVLARPA